MYPDTMFHAVERRQIAQSAAWTRITGTDVRSLTHDEAQAAIAAMPHRCRRWTPDAVAELRGMADDGAAACAQHFGVSEAALTSAAGRYGVSLRKPGSTCGRPTKW